MALLIKLGGFILTYLGTFYLVLVLSRFLLQLARADFHNPISQFIAKLTNPVLIPIRKVVPGIFGLDIASIVLAILVHAVLIQTLAFMAGSEVLNPFYILTWSILGNIALVITIYWWSLLIYILVSIITMLTGNHGVMANPIFILLNQITGPLLRPIQRIMPDTGGIDISPIFVFLILNVCTAIITGFGDEPGLAQAVGINGRIAGFVLGI